MSATRNKAKKPAPAAEKRSGARLSERIGAWVDLHLYSLFSSLGRLAQKPWATLLTVGVMAIALALPLCLAVLLGNVERLSGSFRESRDISLFLKPEIVLDQARSVAERLRTEPGIEAVLLRSPDEGLAEFREMADFAGALALLQDNPLPSVLVITPQSAEGGDTLAVTLAALPEADYVQHDALWRIKLGAWLRLGRHLTALCAALLGLGALLVVGNTVRLDIQTRAEEIRTVQLLGATDGFVRRPFLYLGACYGLLAGVLALAVVAIARLLVAAPVGALVENYGSAFELRGLPPLLAGGALAGAIVLGWLGAWLAAGHHLRRTLPDGGAA
ncbi:cell division transport system permease protein [Chiayiivirga flava]|uniref:Cell division protein FtsX n=1 Tax=Chiayiivirga flava TaxID=659595 RepID=A0A7W8D583_9GAMM|nr:cell division transport system permease protein [Chiayiivirga flava]